MRGYACTRYSHASRVIYQPTLLWRGPNRTSKHAFHRYFYASPYSPPPFCAKRRELVQKSSPIPSKSFHVFLTRENAFNPIWRSVIVKIWWDDFFRFSQFVQFLNALRIIRYNRHSKEIISTQIDIVEWNNWKSIHYHRLVVIRLPIQFRSTASFHWLIFHEKSLLLAPLNEESGKNGCDEIDVHAHPGRHKRRKKKKKGAGEGEGENGFKPIVNFCLVTCLTMLTHPLRS